MNKVLLSLACFSAAALAGAGEIISLVNCQKNGVQSSQIAYFGGSPGGNPDAIAVVPTDSGKTAWWEGAPVKATFSDGNYFVSSIPRAVQDGQHAGTGQNKQAQFECWKHWHENLYRTADGTTCSQVYICNHSQASDKAEMEISVSQKTSRIPGRWTGTSVFRKIWDRRGPAFCDSTPVVVEGGCSIKFDCLFPNDNWQTANYMSSFLIDAVGSLPDLFTHVNCGCERRIEHGICEVPGKCTEFRSQGQAIVWNNYLDHEPRSAGAYVKYEISCGASGACRDCNLISAGIGSIALGNSLPWMAGGLSAVVKAGCILGGC
jgi:hypothetical protein